VASNLAELTARAEELAERHRKLLEDIAWREKDLEMEQVALQHLVDDTDPESLKLLGAQVIVVETITKVLAAERIELADLEKEMAKLEVELRQLVPT